MSLTPIKRHCLEFVSRGAPAAVAQMGLSAEDVSLNFRNRMFSKVLVNLSNDVSLPARRGAATISPRILRQRTRSSIAEATRCAKRCFSNSCQSVVSILLRRLVIARLKLAPGAVGALFMGSRVIVYEDALRGQVWKMFIAGIAQKQRLLAIADEDPRIVRNGELCHAPLRGTPGIVPAQEMRAFAEMRTLPSVSGQTR